MDINLINKLDELINIFENSDELKELSKLKKDILSDLEIQEKINRFNVIKDNIYSSEVIEIRKDLLENKKIKRYKELENNLLLLTMSINKKLNTLINKKGCNNENN
jgi:cell fate (sporulation/competence/biofilm development) regulator YlbF (YheA/YmcA/DUF963 family)